MKRHFRNIRHNKTIQILIVFSLAFFLYTMGFIGMIAPESRAKSLQFTTLYNYCEFACCDAFAEVSFTIRTILVFLAIAVSGYLIETAGVNTGKFLGAIHMENAGIGCIKYSLNHRSLTGYCWFMLHLPFLKNVTFTI